MGKDGASENATPKIEKRIKTKSKKVKKNEETTTEMQDAQSIDTETAIEHVRISEKEDIAETEMKSVRKLDKKKKKKNKGSKDIEADINKDAGEGESTVAYGEGGSGDAVDNAVSKRKKREKDKNKNDGREMEKGSEAKGNEGKKRESTSATNSTEEASKERKKQKGKRKLEDVDFEKEGDKDVKEDGRDKQNKEKKRKKDKQKSKDVDLSSLQKENVPDNVDGVIQPINDAENVTKEVKRKDKKKNKKKENSKDDSSAASQQNSVDKDGTQNDKSKDGKKRKKKGTKSVETVSNDAQDNGVDASKGKKNKRKKSAESGSDNPTPNKSNKKVRFSEKNEVFTLPSVPDTGEGDLVRGKRFTLEEDEMVKQSVYNYIEYNDLGDEGLDMVLNCSKHPKLKGCWKEIASAIPYRPTEAIYFRAHILFRRSDNRKWTQEELDMVIKHQAEHGNKWKPLADELGKHRAHLKDTWRRLKLQNQNKGHWSQKEHQKLFDLVNLDLQLKVNEEKKSKHGMLRDNICWTAVSDNLATRQSAVCCLKWYSQLTSPMVAQGIWSDTDDYRMVDALYGLDATCKEDVDWDSLVEGRSGDLCLKRWNQMTLHIGGYARKSFAEQVEVLAKRYCPHLIEVREAWDNKPRVP
ncbi:hypothetical protein ABFS83_04G171800 [Erythranthe nasuta]